MSEQPEEALQLADELEFFSVHGGGAMDRQAAAKLRRQHAAIERLLEVNAELLGTLKELLAMPDYDGTEKTSWKRSKAKHKARAAIAKAEEVKP
jgi:hypothetical protein